MKKSFLSITFLILTIAGFSNHNHHRDTIQKRLNHGEHPRKIIKSGVPMDSLYGKKYAGGYIFYFFPKDTSGLVIGTKDLVYPHDTLKGRIIWGCRNINTGARETKIGSGQRNTQKIIDANCGLWDPEIKKWMKTAAEVCGHYKTHQFDDWYLPSKDELHEAYMKLCHTPRVNFGKNKEYWTSSEKDDQFAWIEHLELGHKEYELHGQSYFRKFYAQYLRPVRTFK